jgi:benzoylformate decarboxylase
MPASLGIKLVPQGWQGIDTRLVVNAVGDGSSLFYPQTWWTAAHRKLAILYIVTNNHEYHTLQVGLQQVIQAYGSAPGYGWHPKTNDPDYLRIERPRMDFVALAAALGGQRGEVVRGPQHVAAAVRRGVEHVLSSQSSYVLDMRTAPDTPTPPPLQAAPGTAPPLALDLERYTAQPPLDFVHREPARRGVAAGAEASAIGRIPVIP